MRSLEVKLQLAACLQLQPLLLLLVLLLLVPPPPPLLLVLLLLPLHELTSFLRATAGRIWDLRTGRTAFVLQGHVKQVLTLDFHPDGFTVATGGDDHVVKVGRSNAGRAVPLCPERSLGAVSPGVF
jgi:WD40 repeat protein